MVEDPCKRLREVLAITPEAVVLNLDRPAHMERALLELKDAGAAQLLRDALLAPDKTGAAQQKRVAKPEPGLKNRTSHSRFVWFRPRAGGGITFGDDSRPLVVRHVSGVDVAWAAAAGCDLACIGSILSQVSRDAARRNRKSPPTVWGSGLIEPASSRCIAASCRLPSAAA